MAGADADAARDGGTNHGQGRGRDPVRAAAAAALARTAFLLERSAAPAAKAAAFRRAASVVAGLPAGELADRVEAGSVEALAGVGRSTGAVVLAAARGEPADYLARLESGAATLPGLADDAGAGLRARLRGDLHSHTAASDGSCDIETMARAAADVGLDYLAVTDHSPRLRVANGLSAERLRAQLGELRQVQARLDAAGVPLRLLSGIEVDILPDGSLDQDPGLLAELDVVVASVHSELRMASADMTRRMIAAVSHPAVSVLGHCTGRLVAAPQVDGRQGRRSGRQRPESSFDASAVFQACADNGTAVELNARPERQDPPERLIQLALDRGCLLSLDSDAHAAGQLDWLRYGCARAEATGVPPERVVTSWPLAELLGWARSGGRGPTIPSPSEHTEQAEPRPPGS